MGCERGPGMLVQQCWVILEKKAMNKFIVSGLLLLGLALLAGCGSGKQQDQQNTASKIGEPPTIERRIRGCLICHGEAKGAMSSNFPNLDGQHKGYLIKQLTDMKSGRRR